MPAEERLHWRSFLVKLGADNLKGVKNEELLVACHKCVYFSFIYFMPLIYHVLANCLAHSIMMFQFVTCTFLFQSGQFILYTQCLGMSASMSWGRMNMMNLPVSIYGISKYSLLMYKEKAIDS